MSDNTPLVTVYIPTFNRLDILKRAIQSVLTQTYPSLELIVVDDCSTDGTGEYLDNLASRDSRVLALRNEGNKGACYSRNRAIKCARGTFITGLDDDDYFLPGRIESFVRFWDSKDEDTVALTSCYCYSLPGGTMQKSAGQKCLTLNDMYLRNLVGSQIFTLPKTLCDIGGFDIDLQAWQDYELWLRLLSIGNIETVLSHSYVVDRSHDYKRISNLEYQKIQRTCNIVLEKHDISGINALRVKSQMLIYRWTAAEALRFLLLFTLHRDFDGLKAIVMRTLRFFKKTPH